MPNAGCRMLPFSALLLAALIGAFLLGHHFQTPSKNAAPAPHETVYERVMRTGVIRCGYAVWPPIIAKNPNTGELSGIFYDYVNALGEALQLKIDWSYEVSNMATYIQDMTDRKFDLECSGGWPDALRGRQLIYTHPIFYLPYFLYARSDDPRFDTSLEAINDPSIRFSMMDGDFSATIHDKLFPKSAIVSVPSNGPFANLFLEVMNQKADVTGMDAFSGEPALDAYPGQIKRLPFPPLKVVPNTLSIARGETDFLHMMNTASDSLLYDGTIDRILDKYTAHFNLNTLFRIKKPYESR
ncbi:MAG: substrate-binding periplasmic protein [Bdellovibrionales bacterium]